MKKKMIFYFYITDDFFERKTNLVHIECLRKYAQIFDEVEFYLSLDDTKNYELINKIEQILVALPFKGNVSFKIHQNDMYRESRIVESEIANKLDTQDCLLFFAHGKGYTNLEQYEEESMIHWLIGCYYLSLNFMDEVIEGIDSNTHTWYTYGSFPLVSGGRISDTEITEKNVYLDRIKHRWCYSGTFFWINTKKLYNHLLMYDVKLPKMFDRYYSEKFLGNVIPYNTCCTGHGNIMLFPNNNMYNDGVAKGCLDFILGSDEEREKYMDFYNEVMNKINNK